MADVVTWLALGLRGLTGPWWTDVSKLLASPPNPTEEILFSSQGSLRRTESVAVRFVSTITWYNSVAGRGSVEM